MAPLAARGHEHRDAALAMAHESGVDPRWFAAIDEALDRADRPE